jgi:hypothetical protein
MQICYYLVYTKQDKCGDKNKFFLEPQFCYFCVAGNSKYFNLKLCRSVDNINMHLHTQKQFLKRLNIIFYYSYKILGLPRQYTLSTFLCIGDGLINNVCFHCREANMSDMTREQAEEF